MKNVIIYGAATCNCNLRKLIVPSVSYLGDQLGLSRSKAWGAVLPCEPLLIQVSLVKFPIGQCVIQSPKLWFTHNNRPKIITSSCFQCVRLVVLCVRA